MEYRIEHGAGAYGHELDWTTMIQAVVVVNGTRYPVPQQGLRIGRAPENDIVLARSEHLAAAPRRLVHAARRVPARSREPERDLHRRPAGWRRAGGDPDRRPGPDRRHRSPGRGGPGRWQRRRRPGRWVRGLSERRLRRPAVQRRPASRRPARTAVPGPALRTVAPLRTAAGPVPLRIAGPRPGTPGGGGGSKTGLVIGGVIAVLIVAMVGTGTLVLRAVADSRATPTPTSRPVAVSTTSTPPPTAPPKPTEPPRQRPLRSRPQPATDRPRRSPPPRQPSRP